MTSGFRGRTEIPRAVAIVLATLIALPLAESLYQVPVQVSDSLEPIVIASSASSVGQLLSDAPRFSPTTLRPMRYVQARWLLNTVEATGLSYRAVFRGVHVALLMLLVALFVIALRVRTWTDLAAFTIASIRETCRNESPWVRGMLGLISARTSSAESTAARTTSTETPRLT